MYYPPPPPPPPRAWVGNTTGFSWGVQSIDAPGEGILLTFCPQVGSTGLDTKARLFDMQCNSGLTIVTSLIGL